MYTNFNFHPKANTPPQHVAIIPDGGRRWARQHGMSYKEAYLISVCFVPVRKIFLGQKKRFRTFMKQGFGGLKRYWDLLRYIIILI